MFWDQKTTHKTNPVWFFFDWKSDKEGKTGTFKWRNKELAQEVNVMPEQFILLSQISCIKGWDEKTQSKIYSNEIISTKDEDLIVKSFKSTEPLFNGKYNKNAIEAMGGKFNKGIIVLEGKNLVEYFMQWGALFQWNEDINQIDTNEFKVKFDKIEERKKGAVTYYIPRFIKGDVITPEEKTQAFAMVSLLQDYRWEWQKEENSN